MAYPTRRVVACMALVLLAAGCGDNIEFDAEQARAEARETHLAFLDAFLDADAERFVSFLSPDAVDLGGGQTGTGELPPAFFTVERWERYFASEAYNQVFHGESAEEVLDVDATQVWFFSEIRAMSRHYFGEDTIFEPLEDDVWVLTPPPRSAPFRGSWFAVYRKIGDQWRVVGLD